MLKRHKNVMGAVLAGGKARRFGSNKAFATFQGISLIKHVIQVLNVVLDNVILVTNTPEEYSSLSIPIFKDEKPYLGPMGGISTALKHSSCEKIFVTACDMPLTQIDTINKIILASDGFDVTVPIHNGKKQYLMAVYSKVLLTSFESSIKKEVLSLKGFCQDLTRIQYLPIQEDSFANINTTGDLEELNKKYAV